MQLELNYINRNLSENNINLVAPWQSARLRSALGLVRNSKRVLFAGLAFARVTILNTASDSEAKWRQLPSLFSEALETEPTVYKSGTLVLVTFRAFFCQSPVVSARTLHWLGSHVIILYRAS